MVTQEQSNYERNVYYIAIYQESFKLISVVDIWWLLLLALYLSLYIISLMFSGISSLQRANIAMEALVCLTLTHFVLSANLFIMKLNCNFDMYA